MKFIFWLTVTFALIQPHALLEPDVFSRFLADSGMYFSAMDGSAPIELDYDDYYTSRSKFQASSTVEDSYFLKSPYNFFGIVLVVVFMSVIFGILYYINSSSYRRQHAKEFQKINLVLDNGLESIAVIDILTNGIDTTDTKFVPRDNAGNVLPVLLEESQE